VEGMAEELMLLYFDQMWKSSSHTSFFGIVVVVVVATAFENPIGTVYHFLIPFAFDLLHVFPLIKFLIAFDVDVLLPLSPVF
jgi:hypothetical protein